MEDEKMKIAPISDDGNDGEANPGNGWTCSWSSDADESWLPSGCEEENDSTGGNGGEG
ncbi:hypothetical protein [Vreelandella jeotgali]|uniref:hypothetical protein n=1 Tax=Vreelandella jeotgali TaxID=553386 RepID=UPI00146165DD|nr:hypothetical protein [Halomonas jeotgali]